ncbi:MAG TPA: ATP-binding protein [Bacillota bacterium]|nr:ATP-binding protein [Bacillota bacterium]
MNTLSIIHYTVFLFCMGLICLILIKNPKATLNRVGAFLFGCFAIWEFTLTFFYAAPSESQAMLWNNIGSIGWSSLAGFYLWFTLVFTNQESILKKWYFYLGMGLIPTFFIYLQWTGHLISRLQKPSFWWQIIWSNSSWTWLFYVYYFVFIGASICLNYLFIKKTSFAYVKKQARLMVVLGIINLSLAFINNVLSPQLKVSNFPITSSLMTLLWAGGITYAITKYKLMVLTPAYAASDIIGAMNDSLILIDSEGKLIEANNATLKLLGYTRAELIGQPVELLFSEEIPIFAKIILEKGFTANSLKDNQLRYRTKNETMIPISFSGAIMRDGEANFVGIVGVARDLRESLRLQASEQEFMVEKARAEALQERAQELQEAYDKLKAIQAQLIQSEKMAAVGQLAGGVAHEINNPMGIILGFSQSISKRIKEADPLYLPLKSIEREAMRCKKLVGDLLTFSRSGKSHAEIIDLNQTIDETLSLIELQAKVKEIELFRNYDPSLPRIKVNKSQIQQVILNLCNNAIDAIDAIDAMPEGGKITLITKVNQGQIVFEVSDNGVGMSEDVKRHIFVPFFTTKGVGKGTGLGLSLCYEIIQKHHGVIEVESEVGQGATFRVKLPLNDR